MTQRKGEILIPRADVERMRLIARRPPNPGIRAGIGGWLEWQLIDKWGRAVRGGEQHNLFLNSGLDQIAQGTVMTQSSWFSSAVVGTGSTEPDVTDTAIVNEVGTSSAVLDSTVARTGDGVYEWQRTFEFDFNDANGNLTEWGVYAGSALAVRELFRDGAGIPIVVTKTSDYKLRIIYRCELALSPVSPEGVSFEIAGIGVVSGRFMWLRGPDQLSSGHADRFTFANLARAYANNVANSRQGIPLASDSAPSLNYATNHTSGGMASDYSWSSYSPGQYSRSISGFWGTGAANQEIRAFGIQGNGTTANRYWGWAFVIDVEDRFTKDNEHTLTINDLLTVTWGRA